MNREKTGSGSEGCWLQRRPVRLVVSDLPGTNTKARSARKTMRGEPHIGVQLRSTCSSRAFPEEVCGYGSRQQPSPEQASAQRPWS